MSPRSSFWRPHAASDASSVALRRAAATVLVRASVALERLATVVGPAPPPAWTERDLPLEFHPASDDTGGALYVDGLLVGRLDGVRRL